MSCGWPIRVDPRAQVVFYAARYDQRLLGIFPVGDPTQYIADAEADVAILEEPEHLTWFHHGQRWSCKFRHVVSEMTDVGQRRSCSGRGLVPTCLIMMTLSGRSGHCSMGWRVTCLPQHHHVYRQEGVCRIVIYKRTVHCRSVEVWA